MNRFGVFVFGRGLADDDSVKRLSSTARLSIADARQLLISRIPRMAGNCADLAAAQQLAESLKAVRLTAYVADNQEVSAFRPTEVRGASVDVAGVSFHPSGHFAPGELRILVHGRFTSRTETRTEATVIDASHSFARVGKGTGQVRREQEEQFLHLFGTSLSEAVELRANRFDFGCLGEMKAPTRAGNIRAFVDTVRQVFPGAIYDDTLLRYPLRDRLDSSYAFDSNALLGSLESQSIKGSTEVAARRTSLLIAHAWAQAPAIGGGPPATSENRPTL